MRKEVVLLVGPQGVGKTHLCNTYLSEYFRISQDDMGKTKHHEIYEEQLKKGTSKIVIDRINHLYMQRKGYLDLAKAHGYTTTIMSIQDSYKTCLERIMARTNHPTLSPSEDAANKALGMYFSQYEYVQDYEADYVQRFGNDPFMLDLTDKIRDRRVVLIGDVHGCFDELQALLKKINYTTNDLVIFSGDLVDRGPKVQQVLDWVKFNGYTVMSNHEHKYLRYLKGNQVKISHDLKETIEQVPFDKKTRYWLESLPYVIKFGNNYVVHAGIDPTKPVERQRRDTLMYARTFNPETMSYTEPDAKPWFTFNPPSDNIHVYFGHQIYDKTEVSSWATSLDGGCVHGGVLRAVIINSDGSKEVVEVKSDVTWSDTFEVEETEIHESLIPFYKHAENKLITKSEMMI